MVYWRYYSSIDSLSAGQYTLTVTDCNGCTGSATFTVNSVLPIPGCTDPTAFNYDSLANVDDGSCIPVILGCTDVNALNFDASANTDDGSCILNPSPVSGISCSSGLQSFVFSDNLDVNNGWTGDISTAAGDWDFPTSFPGGNSTSTGPSGPAPGTGTTWAEYEASGSQDRAVMTSPAIDLTNAVSGSSAELSFYMHAYGSEIGTLNCKYRHFIHSYWTIATTVFTYWS